MLIHLSISNYAIIRELNVDFGAGFSVITGQTGAGKSIMLGAMNLLLGERHDARVITDSSRKAVVEAQFDISRYHHLAAFFEAHDIDYDPQLCILRREVLPNNRTRAFINDSPATLQQLKELATRLIDIHSQSNNALVAKPKFQLSVLDGLITNRLLLEDYTDKYRQYADALQRQRRLEEQISIARQEEDYNRFLLSQFADVELSEGIEQELTALQLKLENATDIKSALSSSYELLEGEDASVIGALKAAKSRIDSVAAVFRTAQSLSERLESTIIELRDLADTLSGEAEAVEADPAMLDHINEQLAGIDSLKRKHNVATADELIAIRQVLTEKVSAVDGADFELEQIKKEVSALEAAAEEAGKKLTAARSEAAAKLSTQLIEAAATLALPNVRFEVSIEPKPLSPDGADSVAFLVAFNKNQPLMAVADTASGGEMSRLMLCLKSIIAATVDMPTLVLDEIDTGVSGQVAAKMAEMMVGLSEERQVIAITHLPQVAAKAKTHYRVYKQDSAETTTTHIAKLSPEQQVEEIAAMLSGSDIDEAALANAKSLINS